MMKTVSEVSKLSGVSVRTLHYYDSIDLLKPSYVSESGYRMYDDTTVSRLQTILFFKELKIPLKTVKQIISDPDYDRKAVLEEQIKLLKAEKERTEKIIELACKLLKKEVIGVDFSAFDKTKVKQYADEAKKRFGNTPAYSECEAKSNSRSEDENELIAEKFMLIFKKFGAIKDLSPDSSEAQELVKELKNYISGNYYNCTSEILRGLGAMYTQDERFRETIDGAGGNGTAEFVSKAIQTFTKVR